MAAITLAPAAQGERPFGRGYQPARSSAYRSTGYLNLGPRFDMDPRRTAKRKRNREEKKHTERNVERENLRGKECALTPTAHAPSSPKYFNGVDLTYANEDRRRAPPKQRSIAEKRPIFAAFFYSSFYLFLYFPRLRFLCASMCVPFRWPFLSIALSFFTRPFPRDK